MNQAALFQLVQTTLRQPRAAAQIVMTWDFSRDVLWTAMTLVAALNAFVLSLVVALMPQSMMMPGYASSPLVLFVLVAGMMVVFVHALYWAGSALGGQGSLDNMLALTVWLQTLRAGAQIAIILLSFLVPVLATLASVILTLWSVWILLNFILTALNLPSIGHALIVLVLSGVGLVLGMGILLALIGLAAQGVLT
ncbi:MAG: hypothetical protein ACJAVM_000395 [Sulfitobacter sp.]|jgi:Yip1 domain